MGIPFHEVRLWSAAVISLYQCYYMIEPWGVKRDDYRAAHQNAGIAAIAGVKKQGDVPFVTDDFLLSFESKEKEETENTEPAGLRDAFKALSGKK